MNHKIYLLMYASILKIVHPSLLIFLFSAVNLYATSPINEAEVTMEKEDLADDLRRKIRLGFTAPSTIHRQLLLTEDENASSGIDWGYDSEYLTTDYEDMYWLIEDQLFIIQGTDIIDEYSSFPLGFHTHNDGMSTIGIDGLENISEEFSLYLFDTELEIYHNLRANAYEFYAEAGEYLDRFALVFTLPQGYSETLSIDENERDSFKMHYDNGINTLIVNNPFSVTLKTISVYNLAGQLIHVQTLNEALIKLRIQFNNRPAQGTYIVLVETDTGTVSKKVLFY
ncbi:T9SS type A sorting domain-containing protein [Winogradskyella sp.]|uniref:T9SS type A sorting domain-containing protein n=1 Tax=Winogradskyella sp. TaxID=1883156 RepID=UPI003BA8B536